MAFISWRVTRGGAPIFKGLYFERALGSRRVTFGHTRPPNRWVLPPSHLLFPYGTVWSSSSRPPHPSFPSRPLGGLLRGEQRVGGGGGGGPLPLNLKTMAKESQRGSLRLLVPGGRRMETEQSLTGNLWRIQKKLEHGGGLKFVWRIVREHQRVKLKRSRFQI